MSRLNQYQAFELLGTTSITSLQLINPQQILKMAKFVAVILLIAALVAATMAYPRAAENKETLQAENSFGLGYGLYGGGLGGLGGGLGYGGLGYGGLGGFGLGHGLGFGGLGFYGR